jgi:rhamnose utilization protein RhaD (predicted bifunctional aldolase and dehydrogenase)
MVPFSHGENLYVADMETEMTSLHPAVSAVQIGGQGRPKPFLLVEWKDHLVLKQKDKEGIVAFLLEETNKRCSDLVKLTPDLVLFTRPDKALVRTVKGTISRKESEELYEEEIGRLYHREIGS